MSTASALPDNAPAQAPEVERRGAPRHIILQRCLVWPPGACRPEGWPCIAYNISTIGIGISLPCPLQPGVVLKVQAWGLPRARELEARVVEGGGSWSSCGWPGASSPPR
jgi:hypothetical protein